MRKVIISRLLRLAATLLAVTFLTFSLTSLLPGDPVNAILGVDSNQDPELVAEIRDGSRARRPVPRALCDVAVERRRALRPRRVVHQPRPVRQ